MNDAADTIRVEVELALAEADRQYEAAKKRWETPVKLTFADATPGSPTVGRTFSGAAATTGPLNYAQSTAGERVVNVAASSLQQQMQSRMVMGGTGFAPAASPVPTAHVNTYYGDASRSLGAVRFGGQFLPQQPVAPIASPIPGGTSNGAFVPSIGPAAPMGARVGSFFSRAFPTLRGQLGSVFGYYGGINSLSGVFEGQNAYNEAMASASGDPFSMARASIANDPMRGFVGNVPLLGGLATSAADFFNGGLADSARTLRGAEASYQLSTVAFSRSLGIRSAERTLGITQAAASGTSAAQIASISAMIGEANDTRTRTLDADRETNDRTLREANEAVKKARDAVPNYIELRKPGGGFSYVAATPDATTGRIAETYSGAEGVNSADLSAIRSYNNAVDARNGLRDKQAKNAADADRIRDLAIQNANGQLRNVIQQSADATRQSSTAAAFTIRATSLNASAFALNRAGFGQQAIGQQYAADVAGIGSQFGPQIDQAKMDLARLSSAPMAGLTPAAMAAQFGSINASAANLSNLVAQQQAAQQQASQEYQANLSNYGRGVLGQQGGIAASNLRLSLRPFDAQRTQVATGFAQSVVDKIPGTNEFSLALGTAAGQLNEIDQAQRFATVDINRGLSFESQAQSARFARNEVGAAAATIAGAGIERATQLRRGGFKDEATRAQANTISELNLTARDYAYSFRAEAIDLQTMAINNPRDSQDPEAVFASISRAKQQVQDANLTEGQTPDGKNGEALTLEGLKEALTSVLPNVLSGLVQ